VVIRARNILFDLDGTLTDSRPGIVRAIQHALQSVGIEAPGADDLLWCVGPPLREVFGRLLANREIDLVERAVAAYVERYDAVGYRENRVYAGVPEMLFSVGPNRRLVIVTAKRQAIAENIINLFQLRSHFIRVFGTERSGLFAEKRDLVHHVIGTLGLERSETVIVGDRVHDIEAGRHNGIFTVGAAWGYGTPGEFAAADCVGKSPLHVAGLFA
jgi:phosphoglycolate phosphatase